MWTWVSNPCPSNPQPDLRGPGCGEWPFNCFWICFRSPGTEEFRSLGCWGRFRFGTGASFVSCQSITQPMLASRAQDASRPEFGATRSASTAPLVPAVEAIGSAILIRSATPSLPLFLGSCLVLRDVCGPPNKTSALRTLHVLDPSYSRSLAT